MILDIVAVVLALLLFVRGYKQGIVVAAFSVLAILLGISCALTFAAKFSNMLFEKGFASSALAPFISYAILFIGVVWIVRLLAKFLEKLTATVLLGWVNKSVGGIMYIAIGMVMYSTVLWLCHQAHLIAPETIVKSVTYKYIEPLGPWVFEHTGQIFPFVKDAFAEMRLFFEGINQQLPEHVGAY